ncbi:MAG: Clp protease N-terminal domain-containing protein [Candidatus Limnocylindria bacterium]
MGPFDRFNDRAKRVLALAQDEAIRFNHNYIGVEHLLLGLVREGEGVAARVLDSLGVDLSKARSSVEFMIGRGDSTTSPSEITLSPRTKKVIELAIDEARKLGHGWVGTEHLLLGLAREGESVATHVLQSLGVGFDRVRHEVIATLGQQQSSGPTRPLATVAESMHWGGHPASPLDRLDASSRRALARAYWEAGRANEEEIMPHHLLLALVADKEVWIRRVLAEVGIDPADLAARIDAAAPARPTPRLRAITESPALLDVITRAASLAAERNHAYIRGGHLLVAIASGDGVGATVLTAVGATPQRLREIIDRMKG